MADNESKGSFFDMLNENIKSIDKMTKSLNKASAMLEKKVERLKKKQDPPQKPWEVIKNEK